MRHRWLHACWLLYAPLAHADTEPMQLSEMLRSELVFDSSHPLRSLLLLPVFLLIALLGVRIAVNKAATAEG
jgi:hypothetical protein